MQVGTKLAHAPIAQPWLGSTHAHVSGSILCMWAGLVLASHTHTGYLHFAPRAQGLRMSFPGPRTYSRLVSLHRALLIHESKFYGVKAHYCQEQTGVREPVSSPRRQTALMEAFPKVMVQPRLLPVSVPPEQCQFIIFDLETTGITVDSDICQIAAMKADPEGEAAKPVWSTYLIPGRSIDRTAHRVTGLSTDYHHGHKCLFLHGKPVKAQQYEEGIQSFYSYLQKQSSPGKHTVLVAYGCERLDAPVLVNNFNRCGISRQDLGSLITGFSDALKIIRRMRADPSMVKDGLLPTKLSLSSIYNHLFNVELTDAHNAITDTRALNQVLFQSQLKVTPTQLLSSSTTLGSAHDMAQYLTTSLSNLYTMKGKLFNYQNEPKISITRPMAMKIAKSGIRYEDLARVYSEYGANGITELLGGPCSGREHRITSDKDTIDAVIEHFQSI